MKKTLVFILLISLLAQSFNQAVIMVSFYINRAYIAKNLCENRSRPMLHCNGKCILAKKLKQQREKNMPELKMPQKAEIISSRSFFPEPLIVLMDHSSTFMNLTGDKPTDISLPIFHPPSLT